jgi:FKBP-type peptidyl-prolyl cis-trans isomerase
MKTWRTAIAGGVLVGLGLCGCEEPSGLVEVSPPGAMPIRVNPDADPAQALGEAAPSTVSPPAAKEKSTDTAKLAAMKTAPATAKGETKTTPGGVKYETLKEGTGPELQPGQNASIHYEGTLESGKTFDSSRRRGAPLKAAIGVMPLIKGWEEGIPGMKVGEVRKLIIPPQLGYGHAGKGPDIPPEATLVFEVELMSIDEPAKAK